MVQARRHGTNGFTLIELLITIALIGILVALVMPNANPAIRDQLVSTAQIVAGDLAYARSLAVVNDSTYRLTFDLVANRYTLQHVGSNPILNALPASLFQNPTNPPATQHVMDLDDLPNTGATVRLLVAGTGTASSVTPVSQLEFGPLGGLTGGQNVYIWLTAGEDASRRYVYLQVDQVTGLTTVGPRQDGDPDLYSSIGPTVALGAN